ncbi:MAG: Na+/H+ antiporter NhaA [Chitinophagales bacterium]|nr:Na+/H+ antiporter NhaA [Chitinophagales bacterium]
MIRRLKQQIDKTLQEFISHQQSAGFLIIGATILALVLGNLPVHELIEKVWHTDAGIHVGTFNFQLSLHAWVNDGLMAIFFFMVGLEIKRELIDGALSSFKKASLPVAAALGGMIVPALIYAVFNFNNPATAHGWGVPMATDIAFALAVLLLAGNRVPFALKLLLTSLAVVDDLGAIVVIAIFYAKELHLNYLLAAGGITLWMGLMNYAGVKRFVWYIVPGVLLWYAVFQSGIHATIAGVIHAMMIPYDKNDSANSTLVRIGHEVHVPVNFLILPLFAFSNTLITFTPEMFHDLASPMSLGIALGLMVGKPVGITLFVWLAVKTGFSTLDGRTNIKQVLSVAVLGGIGFTMSIFVSMLAFEDANMINASKLAILLSSSAAAIAGLFLIKRVLKEEDALRT